MATRASDLQPIQITAGVEPSTDRTSLSTPHFTLSDKIRFQSGNPQKIGGFRSFMSSNGLMLAGIARSLFSATLTNQICSLVGTSSHVYALEGQTLTNIGPLSAATTAIPNSLATHYGALAANPLQTVAGSPTITINDAQAGLFAVGDRIVLSGATSVGGIPASSINTTQVIRSVGSGNYTIRVGSNAVSTATGGGTVTRATSLITVTANAHGQPNGNMVGILAAAATGGISAPSINTNFIIRNVTTNTFDVLTSSIATSSVSGGGGSATTYQVEIGAGAVNQSYGVGYGMGQYGTGLYGTGRTSTLGVAYPRIWIFDRFAATAIMTPGNQGGLYQWQGSAENSPTLVQNAPTAINYAFVSDNIVVTLGANAVPNRIFASDQGNPTIWTASSENQVFEDDIEGAEQFISHVPANGVNLLFTNNQTYIFSYIGLPLVWKTQLLDSSIGIIGPMARCSVNNIAYWMGNGNFYMWRGGGVEIIPANTIQQSTLLNYVFNNINRSQASKCFAWYNALFSEVWFHYPSTNSNECDSIARVSLLDNTWSPDTFDRTCAEYPANLLFNPRMISSEGTIYIHETGTDADGQPMLWSLVSNIRTMGKRTGLLSGIIPDSVSSATINVRIQAFRYPQSSSVSTFDQTFVTQSDSGQIPVQISGGYWQYTWSGNSLGQAFNMGAWQEYVQPSAANP